MSRTKIRALCVAASLAMMGGLAACEGAKGNGSAEKAGEKIDNAMDDLTKDHRDITDGPAENLGERADSAAGNSSAADHN
ncbi:MAG: hypothetical protein AB7M12_11530 [Hyphomonadaceae bacterium]